jgi:hypothetical protein
LSTVTSRIAEIKQPHGGYLPVSSFELITDEDNRILEEENIHASIVGMCVDYITRFMSGTSVRDAFSVSIRGAKNAEKLGLKDATALAFVAVRHIKGLDDDSILNACKLVSYDVWYRNVVSAPMSKSEWEINPDDKTISNIRIMVERSLKFLEKFGPIEKDGFTFEGGGYTDIVDSGDGDYLTKDTLWDFKVSKNKITSKHTLQILMYWIMGKHSSKEEFKNVVKIGIFNPRRNEAYLKDIASVPIDTIREIEKKVIGYK